MGVKRPQLEERNKDIRAQYNTLAAQLTPKGRQELRHEAIVERLAGRFYLAEATIGRILKED